MPKTILVLAANPNNTPLLRLDQEVREIDNGLERAQKRNEFVLKQKWAARPIDVRRAVLDYQPHIVHFCGHGAGEEGIAFEDEHGQEKLVSTEALAGFFELFADRVECVVLNACYSEAQAGAIARYIPFVIGMNKAIGDAAAIEFAVAFYDALGAGKNVEFAYKLACNAIRWAGIPEELTPVLFSSAQRGALVPAAQPAMLKEPELERPQRPVEERITARTVETPSPAREAPERTDIQSAVQQKMQNRERPSLHESWVTDMKFEMAASLLKAFIEQYKMTVVSQDNSNGLEVITTHGSQLAAKMGGMLIDAVNYPKRARIRLQVVGYKTGVDVEIVDSLEGVLYIDPVMKGRYNGYFRNWMKALQSLLPPHNG